MKKWLCLFFVCCLLIASVAACGGGERDSQQDPPDDEGQETGTPAPVQPAVNYAVDFSDGKTGFLMMNTGAPGTDPDSKLEVGTVDGVNALKLTAPGGKALRLGINLDGLLGSRISDVKTVVLDLYAQYPDGNFHAVSGRISFMSGDTNPFDETNWQIYLATRNPTQYIIDIDGSAFSSGANILEISCTTNGPADKGETPAVIVIKSIAFFDSDNLAIEVNTDAGWAAPDGYGDFVILGGWVLPNPPPHGDPGGWQTWFTPGTDNDPADYMPWEVLAASFGIVFEMDQPDSFEFVYFGAFNSWSWTQNNVSEYWDNGTLTIMWEDIGFNPALITEEENQAKIAMGNWGEVDVTYIYLLYDEDAMP